MECEGGQEAQSGGEEDHSLAPHPRGGDDGQDAAGGRAGQVGRVGTVDPLGLCRQQQGDGRAAAEERGRQGDVVQGEHRSLPPVVGDAEGIEWQVEGEQVGANSRQGKPPTEAGQGTHGVTFLQAGEKGEEGAAGAKAEQGQADDHEGEMVELRHREEAREVDFKGQRGR